MARLCKLSKWFSQEYNQLYLRRSNRHRQLSKCLTSLYTLTYGIWGLILVQQFHKKLKFQTIYCRTMLSHSDFSNTEFIWVRKFCRFSKWRPERHSNQNHVVLVFITLKSKILPGRIVPRDLYPYYHYSVSPISSQYTTNSINFQT